MDSFNIQFTSRYKTYKGSMYSNSASLWWQSQEDLYSLVETMLRVGAS